MTDWEAEERAKLLDVLYGFFGVMLVAVIAIMAAVALVGN